MTFNDNKTPSKEKTLYTLDQLLSDILRTSVNDNEEDGEEYGREHKDKIIVMQIIAELAKEYGTDDYKDDAKLTKAIDGKLNKSEMLSGYMFYVSQNPQFDYSWNYMRKCKAAYGKYLMDAIRFLANVMVDINMMAGLSVQMSDIHVVFNEVLDVELLKESPKVRSSLIWDSFNRITKAKSEYGITVKMKNYILSAGSRKKAEDADSLVRKALEKANNVTVAKT